MGDVNYDEKADLNKDGEINGMDASNLYGVIVVNLITLFVVVFITIIDSYLQEGGNDMSKKVFEFDNIEAVTLLGKKKMNIYYNNETYQVFGDKKLNLLKYMHLHYIIKNKGKEDDYEFLGL